MMEKDTHPGAGLDAGEGGSVADDAPGYLTSAELARRLRRSTRTLERWRRDQVGPPWLRLRGRVLYRIDDVVAYERACLVRREGTP